MLQPGLLLQWLREAHARAPGLEAAASVALLGAAAFAAAQTTPKSRLFLPQDLGLLEAPDRDQWQRPDQIMDALKIAEGDSVADLGAGGGWFVA